MRLNLGAGVRPIAGWVNTDRCDGPGITDIWDLDEAPWPWKDASAARIEARDIFEHVASAVTFMVECHRILEPGGVLHLHTPYYRNADAFTDPTHRRFPTEHTFDYWIPGTLPYQHNRFYGGVSFTKVDLHLDAEGALDVMLRKA